MVGNVEDVDDLVEIGADFGKTHFQSELENLSRNGIKKSGAIVSKDIDDRHSLGRVVIDLDSCGKSMLTRIQRCPLHSPKRAKGWGYFARIYQNLNDSLAKRLQSLFGWRTGGFKVASQVSVSDTTVR